ncbi:MAG: TRAM domain-containing protein [bacterium]
MARKSDEEPEHPAGSTVELTISDLGWSGDGVARTQGGRVVLIPDTLPGDGVLARITHVPPKAPLRATVERLFSPSPQRVPHPCPHLLGGCPASPLGAYDQDSALDWKRSHLIETLRRIGRVENPSVDPVLPSPKSWRYRDRLEFHLLQAKTGLLLGYLGREGQLVPISDCLLGSVELAHVLANLREQLLSVGRIAGLAEKDELRLLLRTNGLGGVVAVVFHAGRGRIALDALSRWLESPGAAGWQIRHSSSVNGRFFASRILAEKGEVGIHHHVAHRELITGPTVFTQANTSASRLLNRIVLEELPRNGHILDLYGGFGAFALEYAAQGGSGVVIESAGEAVDAGKAFAEEHNLLVSFQILDLDQPKRLKVRGFDAAILDPPRAGVSRALLEMLNAEGPQRLVYAACHPAALARDLTILHAYRPTRFRPVDLFPGTVDVETVAILQRRVTEDGTSASTI